MQVVRRRWQVIQLVVLVQVCLTQVQVMQVEVLTNDQKVLVQVQVMEVVAGGGAGVGGRWWL